MNSGFSNLVLPICVIIAVIFVIWQIVNCCKEFSDWRVSKNSKKYFELNKKLCEKNKEKGKEILELFAQYIGYIKDFDLCRTIRCSNSVVSNSSQNPVKYLLKYSDINNKAEDMEKLEFISDFMADYELFIKDMEKLGNRIKKNLPIFYRIFADKKRLPYTICGLNYKITELTSPYLCFLYISPGGRSRNENIITIDVNIIKKLVQEISKSVTKKGHSKLQRSIMTNDLREAIKKRDNYTCCKCGNSVYNEPNLLLEVDHIVPVSKGGKTEASNLQTLCWRCNRAKGDKE